MEWVSWLNRFWRLLTATIAMIKVFCHCLILVLCKVDNPHCGLIRRIIIYFINWYNIKYSIIYHCEIRYKSAAKLQISRLGRMLRQHQGEKGRLKLLTSVLLLQLANRKLFVNLLAVGQTGSKSAKSCWRHMWMLAPLWFLSQ